MAYSLGVDGRSHGGGSGKGSPYYSVGCLTSTTFAGSVYYSCRFTSCFQPRCWATPVR